MQKDGDNEILFVSTFPPRECGIATFTKDLVDAIDKRLSPTLKTSVCAMNTNGTNIYNYGKKVRFQISDTNIQDYIDAAKKINSSRKIKLVSIQHEFGIFGGEYGSYLLSFLKNLTKPVFITFHSILPNPEPERKEIVKKLAEHSSALVVMTKSGVDILRNDYEIQTPIKLIPHGIPEASFDFQGAEKKRLGLEKKLILSSFGLTSQNKGYEYVIEALPKVVEKFPNVLYLIVGQTHPIVRKNEGEKYRNMLEAIIKKHNLKNNVKFYNKYLTKEEIIQYLKASDIYISPSLTKEQITSGTLVYAMGAGRSVISTPFTHANDIITEDRGLLVKFEDAESISDSIIHLLSDNKLRRFQERNNYLYTRQMVWPNIALSYAQAFKEHVELPEISTMRIPRINLSHLNKLTDDFGIIQFANFASPNKDSGYTLDDNARALMLCAELHKQPRKQFPLKLMKTYLNYIKYVQDSDGKFYNVVNKEKEINKEKWSEEAHARALRALAYTSSIRSLPREIRKESEHLLSKSLKPIKNMNHSRAIASILAGLYFYNKTKYSEKNITQIKKLADKLLSSYEHNSSAEWKWFEPMMTYANAKLPEALMYAYIATQDKKYLMTAKESFDFLIEKTFQREVFVPIGQEGWYDPATHQRAIFDQQPIEAASMTRAAILAYEIFDDEKYRRCAFNSFNWFLGQNITNTVVYNEQTGGCHDGLGHEVINTNQGAESTLAYLQARLSLGETI